MNEIHSKPRRWFSAIPMEYREDGGFWIRDGGLLCRGLRMAGVDSRFVALGKPCVREDLPLTLCTPEQMQDSKWWKQWNLDGVFLYSWALPRYEPIARAIKIAGAKLVIMLDTDGIVSPHVWPRMYLRYKYVTETEKTKWCPAGWALLKTAVASFRIRHAGTVRHLEHADCIVIPSPLAKQRYSRFLLAVRRPDLIRRLRFAPYPVVKEMTYDPHIRKQPIIVAVGGWQRFQKNAPLLVRILGRVLSEEPRYSARIIGGGNEFVGKLIKKLSPDCRSRIEIIGGVDHEKLPASFQDSQIILCSSYHESFHIVTGEALCCGCSVVADARISSMPHLASFGSGTLACDSSLNNFRDALLAEIDAWQSGERDPVQISKTWRAKLHPDRVAQTVLGLV